PPSIFNQPSTPELYTLSLHDALPIYGTARGTGGDGTYAEAPASLRARFAQTVPERRATSRSPSFAACCSTRYSTAAERTLTVPKDRKSTRLNSSHRTISYAVFCLKKK